MNSFLRSGYGSAGKEPPPPRHTPFYGGTQISLPHSWPTIAPYTDAVAYSSRIRIQFYMYFNTILSASKCIKSIFFFFGYFNSKFVSIYHLSQASYARILCVIILYFIILKCLMNGTNWKVLITTYSSLPHTGLLFHSLYFDPNVT
jgi:hypothetical protein